MENRFDLIVMFSNVITSPRIVDKIQSLYDKLNDLNDKITEESSQGILNGFSAEWGP